MPSLDSSDFTGSEAAPDCLRCDICIVGTGPAGIVLARELSGTAIRVTILESGRAVRQPETDALNAVENVGWPRVVDQWLVRNRILGGSSSTWTGRCAPFDEIDLAARDWVPFSGWPVEWDDLVPYLDRSAAYLGLGAGSSMTGDGVWASIGHARSRLRADPDELLPMFWQYSRDSIHRYDRVRFGDQRFIDFAANVTLVTNATVTRINPAQLGNSVESIEFASIDKRRWILPVSAVVLCAGGIENARLLLASDTVVPHGLGNERDLVGRFLMDHPRGTVARFSTAQAQAVLGHFGMFRSRAVGANLYQHGMRLSPNIQRSEQLLNCAAWVGEHVGPDDPWDSVTRLLRGQANVYRDVRTMMKQTGLLARGIKDHFLSHRGLPRNLGALTLDAMCEQRPNPDSRLVLSDRRDYLGVRIPSIDWRVSEAESGTLRRIAELMAKFLAQLGVEPPTPEDWVRDGAMFPETIRDAAHPTGTTRMADSPTRGVVDAQCQVHGVNGLFIAGSSVFPTSGHANPTQMIVALALRLADTLRAYGPTATRGYERPVVSIRSDQQES